MPVRIRKQFYIDPDQERGLKRLARRTGHTEAELVRQAISDLLKGQAEEQRTALQNIEDFIRKLTEEIPPAGPGRTWKRQDLYDREYERDAKKSA